MENGYFTLVPFSFYHSSHVPAKSISLTQQHMPVTFPVLLRTRKQHTLPIRSSRFTIPLVVIIYIRP